MQGKLCIKYEGAYLQNSNENPLVVSWQYDDQQLLEEDRIVVVNDKLIIFREENINI